MNNNSSSGPDDIGTKRMLPSVNRTPKGKPFTAISTKEATRNLNNGAFRQEGSIREKSFKITKKKPFALSKSSGDNAEFTVVTFDDLIKGFALTPKQGHLSSTPNPFHPKKDSVAHQAHAYLSKKQPQSKEEAIGHLHKFVAKQGSADVEKDKHALYGYMHEHKVFNGSGKAPEAKKPAEPKAQPAAVSKPATPKPEAKPAAPAPKPEAAKPAGKTGTHTDISDEDFGKIATQHAKKLASPHNDKVWIKDVHHAAKKDLHDISLPDFKNRLVAGNRKGHLSLARQDLATPEAEKKMGDSEIEDRGATFHHVLASHETKKSFSNGDTMNKLEDLFKSEISDLDDGDQAIIDCPHCDTPITKSEVLAKGKRPKRKVVSDNQEGGLHRGPSSGRNGSTPTRSVGKVPKVDNAARITKKSDDASSDNSSAEDVSKSEAKCSKCGTMCKAGTMCKCGMMMKSDGSFEPAPPSHQHPRIRGSEYVQYVDTGEDARIAEMIAKGTFGGAVVTQPIDKNNGRR